MQKRRNLLAAIGLIAALLLSGCGQKSDVTVSVQSVAMITGVGSVGLADRFAGVVEAGQTVKIEKDNDMEVKEILVAVGDEVSEGDVLFTYDTESMKLDLEKKQLELEQMNNSITVKTEQIETLEKDKKKATSAADQLDYTLQIQELQVDISETKINITAKEKEIDRLQRMLENAEVCSPVDGNVQTINENGAADENGEQQAFMTVAQTGVFRVKGNINEQNMMSLSEGVPVLIRSRAVEDQTWTGTVEMIDRDNPVKNNQMMYVYVDANSEMTQSSKYPFYVTLDSDEGLMLGQHVYIEPGTQQEQTEALCLPAYFINDAEGSPWVWAADSDDKLEKRELKLGAYDENTDTYEVLEGLEPKDYIAFPDETCEKGAAVSYYDEADFNGEAPAGVLPEGDGMDGDDFGYVDDAGYVDEGEFEYDGAFDGDDAFSGDDVSEYDGEEGAVG